MLRLAKRVGARILFANTREAFGIPKLHPQAEKYNGNVHSFGIRIRYYEGEFVPELLCYE